MKTSIINYINSKVAQAEPSIYRTPLVGFASANDPVFHELKSQQPEFFLLPTDILPKAQTVVTFFLPFIKEVIESNKTGDRPSHTWALAYDTTNKLLADISKGLCQWSEAEAVKAASFQPTYKFDTELVMAQWSHRHSAFACGLGTFGLNELIITPKGCGGRFGTVFLETALEPSSRGGVTHKCLKDTGCTFCMDRCPVQALSGTGFARHICYRHLLDCTGDFPDLPSVEICGKCATGPCAYCE